ncbi:MAG: right-handed parallel beta-helix repeat-containing protein [Verrucomicrobia bacterium]|nr:MAG: right-handed parallel beta-helix repeat-containing protein [Verrucomicrobiota bacterium]
MILSKARLLPWLCLILLGAALGAWFYHAKLQQQAALDTHSSIAQLEREGADHIDSRRWHAAAATYDALAHLAPNSPAVVLGRCRIEAGIAGEYRQFAGYWSSQARAALEAGHWDDAVSAVGQVLEKLPADKESAGLLETIAAARAAAAHRAAVGAAQDLLAERRWDAAIGAANAILATHPADLDAATLVAVAVRAKQQAAADLTKAHELFEQATALDQGQFDQQALDWLHEASALAPEDTRIAAELAKMAAYTRTLRVPGDFATPAEALANARPRDRILLGEGTWQGPLSVNIPIDLQGAGTDKTRIECPADDGCPITLGPAASDSRLSGITFRHQSQTAAAQRFSTGLVRGATVTLLDCQFRDACGHGLAVIEGGKATATRCRFMANGWDGAAAMGADCLLEVRDSSASGNFEHGFESWDGAALVAVDNRCEANGRNGIHADNPGSVVTVDNNQLLDNREFGLVLDAAGSGQLHKNTASGNLLGGFVIRAAGRIPVTSNQIHHNHGPGLSLEQGLNAAAFADNALSANADQQLLTDVVFPPAVAPAP